VESDAGTVSEPTSLEARALVRICLATGMRLACQTEILRTRPCLRAAGERRTAQVVRKEAGTGTVAPRPGGEGLPGSD